MRHSAQYVGRGGDYSRPRCALFLKSVKRPGVIIEPLGQKLQLLPLDDRVAIAGRVELSTQRKMRRVTGDAQRRLLMHAGNPVENSPAPGSIGMPGIPCGENVVESGPD